AGCMPATDRASCSTITSATATSCRATTSAMRRTATRRNRMPDRTMAAPSPQLPLALRYPPDQRFETFVARDAGMPARLRDVAQRPLRQGVFVAGAPGTGKTHLALALCAEAEAHGHRAAYLSLSGLAGRLRDALEALDRNDVVALDGIEAIAGERD